MSVPLPDPNNSGNRWHAAAFADFVDSQIQLSENDQSKFLAQSNTDLAGWRAATGLYTSAKYAGARPATANVIDGITAKVRACPAGTSTPCTSYVPAQLGDMEAAVRNTMNSGIWGYWLNCPSGKTPGPGPCDSSDVAVMVSFLQAMASVF